ncbi:PepSY-associated TM helix domain-containing protein [Methylocystis heyeri]|uniref:PepSY domain-containing protein n=1 Tax=Methylocystis heyeri TaxID=391905 RepID=A0A6B8KBE4_9HYPH|nr:PepSY-associated TM helix domain-containing protein [Methylocystis heyeri]QGM44341.1 PepSY domain-containing protein [Methylocystis heyeri]
MSDNPLSARLGAQDISIKAAQERRARSQAQRRLWLDVHLYLGLVVGAMLAVIGLTGSLLVFWQEIDEWLDPAMFTVAAPPEGERAFAPLSDIRAALEGALPEGAKAGGFSAPRTENGCYKVYYQEKSSGDTRRLCIDPYRAKVLDDKVYWSKSGVLGHSFMSFLFQLHWSLLLYDFFGDNGVVVGVAAILLIVSVASGVYLWWPPPGKWRAALTLKSGARGERLNYDIHKLAGIYTALVMLAVLVSGISMNLHDQFVWAVERAAPLSPAQRGENKSGPAEGRSAIPFEAAVADAAASYPEGRLANVGFPEKEDGVYKICRDEIAALSRFIGTRCVDVDQYSGAILGVADPVEGTAGDVFMQWQWPLHSGRAFGMPGRLLVFATGLACPALFVTGVIRWLQKRRARKETAGRRAAGARGPSVG